MSRAFSPPDTLSQDDIRTVADVRRAVWINGFFGLGAGTVTGMGGHLILQTLQRKFVGTDEKALRAAAAGKAKEGNLMYNLLRHLPPLGRNTFMLSFLAGGALGSMVMSTTAGKNAVHLLHPIFDVGRDEHAGQSPYQIATSKAMQQEKLNTAAKSVVSSDEDQLDAEHHRSRSLRRKASMKRRLESGQSLSDTHGSTWPMEEEETDEMRKDKAIHRAELWGKRQTNRRKNIKDRIEHGQSLSDTHSSTWPMEEEETDEMRKDKAMHRAELWGKRQTNRRKTLKDRIEHGKALSNSTGGHWSDENGSEK